MILNIAAAFDRLSVMVLLRLTDSSVIVPESGSNRTVPFFSLDMIYKLCHLPLSIAVLHGASAVLFFLRFPGTAHQTMPSSAL